MHNSDPVGCSPGQEECHRLRKSTVHTATPLRTPSIFDADFPSVTSVGTPPARASTPPPLDPPRCQLYVMVPSNVTQTGDLGRSIFMINESPDADDETQRGTWDPPGGQMTHTDRSPLHAALRAFNEKVGADWHKLANTSPEFQLTRLRAAPDANEAWLMKVALDAQEAESALFGKHRSEWTLTERVTSGYAFVPIAAINAAKGNGDVVIGPIDARLRDPRACRRELHIIEGDPMPLPPFTAPPVAGDFIELHAVHLRVVPQRLTQDLQRAIESQSVWGGLHVPVTDFGLLNSPARQARPACDVGRPVHKGDQGDILELIFSEAEKLRANWPFRKAWRPTGFKPAGDQIDIDSVELKNLVRACETAGLAMANDSSKALSVSIGHVRYTGAVWNAFRDLSTVWELSVAVLRIPCDGSSPGQVVRWEHAELIWPHRRDAERRPLTLF